MELEQNQLFLVKQWGSKLCLEDKEYGLVGCVMAFPFHDLMVLWQ